MPSGPQSKVRGPVSPVVPTSYVIITPVRNEQDHLPRTIGSVVAQTVEPRVWMIVNDGSTDATAQVIDRAAGNHGWIHTFHRQDRGFRQPGTGVIAAFYDGFRRLDNLQWDFLIKLDADLSFERDYFERCFRHFVDQPRLGIAGGTIYRQTDRGWVVDSPEDPPFHVRGATKIYRRACWDQIGGLIQAPGWDTVDELKANMSGWRTCTFPELMLHQHKETGSADGTWRNWVKNGLANYVAGYHPLFMLAKCLRRLARRPFVMGAAGLWWGFCQGYIRNVRRVEDADLIRYVRHQQLNKLMFRPSLWL